MKRDVKGKIEILFKLFLPNSTNFRINKILFKKVVSSFKQTLSGFELRKNIYIKECIQKLPV